MTSPIDKTNTLSQLLEDVKITLQAGYVDYIWVIAEIGEINVNRNGHCYLELIEKDENTERIKAKSRATIWAYTYRTIKAHFETVTNETLHSGLKVLLQVSVEYHEIYGFSLNIHNIDPNYTLGEMAQQRAKIIKQLESDGVINMNKELYFPRVPQRIAIISSETAAGYTDFVEQLKGNGFGYSFDTKLFPAIMQGNDARESIISAFNNIFDDIDAFDTVVLIRGGGSKSDLSCFDDYELAYYITQFPMPVLTGIGHERDESIADIVAHKQLKTPTAVAEFLINKIYDFDALIDEYDKYISDIVRGFFNENNLLLNNLSHKLQLSTVGMLQRNINAMDNYGVKLSNSLNQLYNKKDNELNGIVTGLQTASYGRVKMEGNTVDILSQRLKRWTRNYIDKKENKLQFLQEKVDLINPENILKRGYSIVIHNKEVVTDANSLKLNKNIKIKFAKGYIESVVTKIEK